MRNTSSYPANPKALCRDLINRNPGTKAVSMTDRNMNTCKQGCQLLEAVWRTYRVIVVFLVLFDKGESAATYKVSTTASQVGMSGPIHVANKVSINRSQNVESANGLSKCRYQFGANHLLFDGQHDWISHLTISWLIVTGWTCWLMSPHYHRCRAAPYHLELVPYEPPHEHTQPPQRRP